VKLTDTCSYILSLMSSRGGYSKNDGDWCCPDPKLVKPILYSINITIVIKKYLPK